MQRRPRHTCRFDFNLPAHQLPQDCPIHTLHEPSCPGFAPFHPTTTLCVRQRSSNGSSGPSAAGSRARVGQAARASLATTSPCTELDFIHALCTSHPPRPPTTERVQSLHPIYPPLLPPLSPPSSTLRCRRAQPLCQRRELAFPFILFSASAAGAREAAFRSFAACCSLPRHLFFFSDQLCLRSHPAGVVIHSACRP